MYFSGSTCLRSSQHRFHHGVRVDRKKVLPSWFKVLCATAAPEHYATQIVDLLNRCSHEGPALLAVAPEARDTG
jgi:hypothetical protein